MASRAVAQTRPPFDLQPHEEQLFVAHRHWAYLAKKLSRDIAIGVVPVLVVIVVVSLTSGLTALWGTVLWPLLRSSPSGRSRPTFPGTSTRAMCGMTNQR